MQQSLGNPRAFGIARRGSFLPLSAYPNVAEYLSVQGTVFFAGLIVAALYANVVLGAEVPADRGSERVGAQTSAGMLKAAGRLEKI